MGAVSKATMDCLPYRKGKSRFGRLGPAALVNPKYGVMEYDSFSGAPRQVV